MRSSPVAATTTTTTTTRSKKWLRTRLQYHSHPQRATPTRPHHAPVLRSYYYRRRSQCHTTSKAAASSQGRSSQPASSPQQLVQPLRGAVPASPSPPHISFLLLLAVRGRRALLFAGADHALVRAGCALVAGAAAASSSSLFGRGGVPRSDRGARPGGGGGPAGVAGTAVVVRARRRPWLLVGVVVA